MCQQFEEWRDVLGYEGYYQVSNYGKVRRVRGGRGARLDRFVTERPNKQGYIRVALCKNGKERRFFAHRLVLLAFVGMPPTAKHQTNHEDGNHANNYVGNLTWVTSQENTLHAVRMGFHPLGDRNGSRLHPDRVPKGEKHFWSRYTEEQVREVKRLRSQGVKLQDIVRVTGIKFSAISAFLYGYSWKHVQ